MKEKDIRTAAVIGAEGLDTLARTHVAVFGVGGVGGYTVEALARCGVGTLTLVDADSIATSNINRQIIATESSVGMAKTQAFAKRIADISPDIKVICRDVFFCEQTAAQFDFSEYDYVVDAIDTVASKVLLAKLCMGACTPIISSMGTGGKLSPLSLKVTDIYKTAVCPLARAMRAALKKEGIKKLKAVWSDEPPIAEKFDTGGQINIAGHKSVGSAVFVPAAAGIIIASEVVRDILAVNK